MEAPEALASSTRGVIGDAHFGVNTPHERKMTFLAGAAVQLCKSQAKAQGLQAFQKVVAALATQYTGEEQGNEWRRPEPPPLGSAHEGQRVGIEVLET